MRHALMGSLGTVWSSCVLPKDILTCGNETADLLFSTQPLILP